AVPQLAARPLLEGERLVHARGNSPMRRIKVGLVALAALTVLLPTVASRAQDAYPTRLVRIVVPYPAGGGTDTLARLLADQLSRKWGQPAILGNIGGPAGNIGAAEAARATPDGYTLLLASPGPIATNAFLYEPLASGQAVPGKPATLVFSGLSRLTTLSIMPANATKCRADVSPLFPE